MKIACLQFAPQLGDIDNNLNRADAVLSRANPKDIDLLILPELAFSGYNFKSLKDITPYLEPTASGITSLWARTTALKYDCIVTVGYPEKVDITEKWPASPEYYNSAITVNADGETIANYRKSFLYYCDETWALEGPDGFYHGVIPGLGNVAIGICMDLNPYKFEAPWSAWEFAYHILHKQANLVILTMAWLTRRDAREYSRTPKDPDMETLSYWLARLEPVIRAEDVGEIIIVFANRCGVEDDAVYAGTSCVLGLDNGEVKLYGILGRGEKELLVIDTDDEPKAKLVSDLSSAIPENNAQPPLGPNFEDPAPYTRDRLVPTIEAVLSLAAPDSPVEAHFAHAYYNPQPPKREEVLAKLKSSIPSESRSSSASMPSPSPAASPNTPLSTGVMNRPPSARSQRLRQMEEHQHGIVISEKMMASLEIISVIDLKKDSTEPSSASSMTTNTPWEANPSFFRAEDLQDIIKTSTPVMNGNSRQPSPRTSPTHSSESPSSRHKSRSREQHQESIPVGVGVDLIGADMTKEPEATSITTPTAEKPEHISPSRRAMFGSSLLPRDERSLSPRPKSTGW